MTIFYTPPVCAPCANLAVAVSATGGGAPTLYARERDVEQWANVLAVVVHEVPRRRVGGGESAEAGLLDVVAARAGAIGISAFVSAIHFCRLRGDTFRARATEHAWRLVCGAVRGGTGSRTRLGDHGDSRADGSMGRGGGGCGGEAGVVVRDGGAGAGAGVSQVCGGGVAGKGGVRRVAA